MANELKDSIKKAAEIVTKYVADVATLTVETRYVEIGADGDADLSQAKPAARTVIKLDGDCQAIAPVRKAETGELEVDTGLFDLHQRNVTTAIEYRARVLNALLSVLQSRD